MKHRSLTPWASRQCLWGIRVVSPAWNRCGGKKTTPKMTRKEGRWATQGCYFLKQCSTHKRSKNSSSSNSSEPPAAVLDWERLQIGTVLKWCQITPNLLGEASFIFSTLPVDASYTFSWPENRICNQRGTECWCFRSSHSGTELNTVRRNVVCQGNMATARRNLFYSQLVHVSKIILTFPLIVDYSRRLTIIKQTSLCFLFIILAISSLVISLWTQLWPISQSSTDNDNCLISRLKARHMYRIGIIKC